MRKKETGYLQEYIHHPNTSIKEYDYLEPDLAYVELSHRRGPAATGRISSLNKHS